MAIPSPRGWRTPPVPRVISAVLGVLFALHFADSACGIVRASPGRSAGRLTPRIHRAFTLVELLVVIVVVGILIALIGPHFSAARGQARFANALSTDRQVFLALRLYGEDHGERLPYLATAGSPLGPLRFRDEAFPGSYFLGQTWHWASVIVPDYFDPRRAIETDRAREVLQELGFPDGVVRSHIFLTHCAFAAPAYWTPDQPPDDLSLFRPTRWSEVRFPASKGLLLNTQLGAVSPQEDRTAGTQGVIAVGWADGSAKSIPFTLDSALIVERPFGAIPWPVLSTRNGLAGRDR